LLESSDGLDTAAFSDPDGSPNSTACAVDVTAARKALGQRDQLAEPLGRLASHYGDLLDSLGNDDDRRSADEWSRTFFAASSRF